MTEIYVVSHPRSGRTWLRMMLGKVMALSVGYSKDVFDPRDIPRSLRRRLPRIAFSHDKVNLAPLWQPRHERYRHKKVILLVRDPRDLAVSFFLHLTRARKLKDVPQDLGAFIRSETRGLPQIIDFINSWYANRAVPTDFMLTRFEDLKVDAASELTRIARFIGLDAVPAAINESIDYATFDNMLAKSVGSLDNGLIRPKNWRLLPEDPNDPESFKIRRGKVAGYLHYFGPGDITYAVTVMDRLDPALGYVALPNQTGKPLSRTPDSETHPS